MINNIYLLEIGVRQTYGPETSTYIVCSYDRQKVIEHLRKLIGDKLNGKEDLDVIEVDKDTTYYISKVSYIS